MSQQINLFNPILRQQKKYLSSKAMAQAMGLILLGSLLVAGLAGFRIIGMKEQAESINRQLQTAESQLAKVNVEYAPRQKNKALEVEIQQVESELRSLQKIADTLNKGELGNTSGYSAYLQAFSRQILDGVWLTSLSIQGAGIQIGIQGKALRPELVPAYINRLKNEPVLQGKSFSNLEMQVPRVSAGTQGERLPQKVEPLSYIEFILESNDLPRQAENAGAAKK